MLHKIKIVTTYSIHDFAKKRLPHPISPMKKNYHHRLAMKKNNLSRFANALHLVVGQDCFDVLAQNHHVDIWVHSLFVPTNLT
jgi:hypothetical protein